VLGGRSLGGADKCGIIAGGVVGLTPLTAAESVARFRWRATQQGRSFVMDAQAVTATDTIATREKPATGMLLAGWLEASGCDLDRAEACFERSLRADDEPWAPVRNLWAMPS
jgi:hypothetical protein